jgi:hypothetical protein
MAALAGPAPYSSPWWLERLGKQLDGRRASYTNLGNYYRGQHPLALSSKKFRDEFALIFRGFADNFCQLVVQALEERCTVQGFRVDGGAGDRKAWKLWQDNELDAQSQKAHREAFIKGECSIIVGPGPSGSAIIRAQKPEEVIVAYDDDPLVRAVAMKRWKTPEDQQLATLYYSDRIEKYQAAEGSSPSTWSERRVQGEDWPLVHDLGVVPVVPLVNDPDLDNVGRSEIGPVIPLQNALNKLMTDMLVSSEFASFRQKWVTGLAIPVDPETNKPIETFKAAVDRVWQARDPAAKFGDFEATDLAPYVSAIETVIQHMASETRTPAHYLLGQSGSFPSGESLKATETGLVAKARRRHRDLGEAWEEIIRLGFRAAGDAKRGAITTIETDWRDPETRTESEHVDALVKLASLGVPNTQLWADAGYTPEQIRAFATASVPVAEDPTTLAPKVEAAGMLIRSGFDPASALTAVGLDPIKHLGLLPITVKDAPQLPAPETLTTVA